MSATELKARRANGACLTCGSSQHFSRDCSHAPHADNLPKRVAVVGELKMEYHSEAEAESSAAAEMEGLKAPL